MATAVEAPSWHQHHHHTSYRHHTNTITPASSSSATPRTILQKTPSSGTGRTISTTTTASSSSGMASLSSYSSTSGNFSYAGSSYETQPQHLHGKLHKRSHSKETQVVAPSPQEEFFPSDPAHKKGIIKPLLKKVSPAAGGKLEGKDNVAAVYQSTSSSPYIGGRSSANDLSSFVPTHRQQHKRTISGNSASSGGSGVHGYHSRRYAPTPTQSYPNSIGGDDSDLSDEDDYVGEFGGSGKTSAPVLRIPGTGSANGGSPLAFPPKIPISESAPISPISPLNRTTTLESYVDRKRKVLGGRNSSEEYTESVRAARAMFEKREREKDEKEERKARKSISKEESRRPSNDGSGLHPLAKTRWTFGRHSTPDLGVTEEKTIGIPYGGSQKPAAASRSSLRGVVMRGADEGRRSRSEKRGHSVSGGGGGGIKNQWQGFVMWVRIGFVRMGRKVRSFF